MLVFVAQSGPTNNQHCLGTPNKAITVIQMTTLYDYVDSVEG